MSSIVNTTLTVTPSGAVSVYVEYEDGTATETIDKLPLRVKRITINVPRCEGPVLARVDYGDGTFLYKVVKLPPGASATNWLSYASNSMEFEGNDVIKTSKFSSSFETETRLFVLYH